MSDKVPERIVDPLIKALQNRKYTLRSKRPLEARIVELRSTPASRVRVAASIVRKLISGLPSKNSESSTVEVRLTLDELSLIPLLIDAVTDDKLWEQMQRYDLNRASGFQMLLEHESTRRVEMFLEFLRVWDYAKTLESIIEEALPALNAHRLAQWESLTKEGVDPEKHKNSRPTPIRKPRRPSSLGWESTDFEMQDPPASVMGALRQLIKTHGLDDEIAQATAVRERRMRENALATRVASQAEVDKIIDDMEDY